MTNALEAARITESAWQALSHALLCDRALEWNAHDRFYLVNCSDYGNLGHRPLIPPDPHDHVEDLLHQLVTIVVQGRLAGEFLPPPGVVGAAIICHGWLPPEEEMEVALNRLAAGSSLPPVQEIPGRRRTRFAVVCTSDGRCYQYVQLRGQESRILPSPVDLANTSSLRAGLDTLLFALSPKVD